MSSHTTLKNGGDYHAFDLGRNSAAEEKSRERLRQSRTNVAAFVEGLNAEQRAALDRALNDVGESWDLLATSAVTRQPMQLYPLFSDLRSATADQRMAAARALAQKTVDLFNAE